MKQTASEDLTDTYKLCSQQHPSQLSKDINNPCGSSMDEWTSKMCSIQIGNIIQH
jgi:hypothetical protein